MINHKKQQGAVLFVAIILLLVITIIGVSAVNSAGIKTQVAGNSMFSMLVYQGAESTLAKSQDMYYINKARAASLLVVPTTYSVPAADLPPENIAAGGTLISTSEISFLEVSDCSVSSVATSATMPCQKYLIDAESQLKLTNARDRHLQGLETYDIK